MPSFIDGLTSVLQPETFIILVAGVIGGIIIGALPGLTSTMGVALLLPITFGMDSKISMVMLLGVYCGAIYGGSISAILLKTPGTPASAATTFDGYPMACQGQAGRALTISTVSSAIGGLISGTLLILVSPWLAKFALKFGAPEFFALAIFGLSIIVSISNKSILKGLSAGFLGLLVSTIGIDNVTGIPRFTFDQSWLLNGFQLIPVMIGLFAVSEVIMRIETSVKREKIPQQKVGILPRKDDLLKLLPVAIRSSIIGTFIGAIPGTGGDIAAFVCYNVSLRLSRHQEKFGTGCVEGIASSEAANNGTTGGTLIPLLTLGVPGDSTTAVLLGAFTLQGLQCGPLLFTQHADLISTIFTGFMFANVLLLIFGLLLMRFFIKTLSAPDYCVLPAILILCIVGSFAINKSYTDIVVMFAFGLIGYFLNKLQVPLSPIVLAVILGPMAETNLRRALMISNGSGAIFFTEPISCVLIIVALLSLTVPIVASFIKSRKQARATK